MGLVAIQILNVYNASHISAKLLYVNCTKNHDEVHLWSKVEDHSDSIKHELKTFYSNPNSRYILNELDIFTINKNALFFLYLE